MPALILKARRSIWLSWLLDNPLLVREIRRRMRGRLFSWSLIGYLAALGSVSCVIMLGVTSYQQVTVGGTPGAVTLREKIQQIGSIGRTLYWGMCYVEGFIALIIAPMLTAGLATQEKEKDTFDFLRVTTLSASTFVSGCLLTTACFLLLIFSCTLPILGLTFIFGGVSMQEILAFNLYLFAVALTISAWGIFNSTNYRRTRSVQGSLVALVFIAYLIASNTLRPVFRGFATPFPLTLGGGWGSLATSLVPVFLLMIAFSIAASRRLYDQNNRLFNYKQFFVFFLLVLSFPAMSAIESSSGAPPAPGALRQTEGYLTVWFSTGFVMAVLSILVFGAGQIEKGDEVWQIRHSHPFFRRFLESYLFHLLIVLLWLAPLYIAARLWGENDFVGHLTEALSIVLPSLLMAASLVRCLSVLGDNRMYVMLISFLGLAIFWGIFPLLGIPLLNFYDGRAGYELLELMGRLLIHSSPIWILLNLWDGGDKWNPILAACVMGGLAVVFYLPTLRQSWKSIMTVSYEWSAPTESPSYPADELGTKA